MDYLIVDIPFQFLIFSISIIICLFSLILNWKQHLALNLVLKTSQNKVTKSIDSKIIGSDYKLSDTGKETNSPVIIVDVVNSSEQPKIEISSRVEVGQVNADDPFYYYLKHSNFSTIDTSPLKAKTVFEILNSTDKTVLPTAVIEEAPKIPEQSKIEIGTRVEVNIEDHWFLGTVATLPEKYAFSEQRYKVILDYGDSCFAEETQLRIRIINDADDESSTIGTAPGRILLLDFPHVIAIQLITTWLEVKEYVVLDTALTSRTHRAAFILAISSNKMIFSRMIDDSDIFFCTKWMVKRKIYAWDITLTKSTDSRGDRFFDIFKYARAVEVNCRYSHELEKIVSIAANTLESVKDLTVCHYGVTDLEKMLQSCKRMRSICLMNFNNFDDQYLKVISTYCPQIESLHLPMSHDATDLGWIKLSKHCQKLKKLHLVPTKDNDSYLLRGKQYDDLTVSGAAVVAVLTNCPRMADISIASCRKVTDELASVIATKGVQITALNLSNTAVTCAGIHMILTHCLKLTHLNVSGIDSAVLDETLTYVQNRNLTYLDISSTTGMGFGIIAKCYFNLQYLNMNCCDEVTATALETFHTKLRKLTYLDVSCSKYQYSQREDRMLDQVIGRLLHTNSQMKVLNLERRIADLTALTAALRSSNTVLTSLDFTDCRELTDGHMIALLECCPALTSLNLSHCILLTDAVLVCLGEKCTLLMSLTLNGCDKFTIQAISKLSQMLKKLSALKH